MKLACLDVQYRDLDATAGCVIFENWTESSPTQELTTIVSPIAAYEPGKFYRRELPCLRAVLDLVSDPLDVIIVDGFVWLEHGTPGLGGHLYAALKKAVPVVGVAKTKFLGATSVTEVFRGLSKSPLYVSAAGMELDEAAQSIQNMHGPYRIPTLLKRVDQLCRKTTG
ncbi:MAG: endonuclease V [Acidobacteria bacterium]|nr:endonuclease V [Acidobacteriota bacterium]